MRCITRSCVALLGLALAAPAASWADDPPHLCQSCMAQQQWYQQQVAQAAQQPHNHRFGHVRMCESCMRAQKQMTGGKLNAPPMIASCPTCNPGQAVAGGPPAGYAMVGPTDPAPIGVVQASYSMAGAPGTVPGAASAPGRAVAGGPANPNDPAFWPYNAPQMMQPPRHRRPHVITHLLHMRTPEAVWDEYQAHGKQGHASIPYGPNGETLRELPASVVYGR